MRYVVIGAGPAGVVASETLRKVDGKGSITLIGDEHGAPYSRMAIPYFLADEIVEDGMLLRKDANHFSNLGIEYLNRKVRGVQAQQKVVTFEDGSQLPYDRLLVASGSVPARPPIKGLDEPRVHTCWTVSDAREIRKLATEGSRVVLIGAGFIGSIILNALHGRKVGITVVEMENRMVPRMMNDTAGLLLKKWCERHGVQVRTATRLTSVENGTKGALTLNVEPGGQLEADAIIVATGVRPRMDFMAGSGVATEQGILVDAHMRTNIPEIFAAGDVAQGIDYSNGSHALHPIQPTATEHGRLAALNMADIPTAYQGSLIMNVLDTMGLLSYSFGLWMGVEGGEHAERLDEERYRYIRLAFKEDRLVGAIVVGRFDNVGIIRGLIQSKFRLGAWKKKLLEDPTRVVEVYLAQTKMVAAPHRVQQAG